MRSRSRLFLVLALLVVARGLLVVSLADVFFYDEEGAKGAAAKALTDGLGVSRWQLCYAYHEGGGFLVSHLDSLFFRWLGPSVLALKLTALVTTSIVLAVGWWFARESFGERAAVVFGLFFVLSPETYVRYSLLALGTHFEALIPLTLILHFGARLAFAARRPNGNRSRDWAMLGLSAGFGVYISLQTVAAVVAVGLGLLLRRRKTVKSSPPRIHGFAYGSVGLATAALGFVFGAIPLWWMMSHVGSAAIRVRLNEPSRTGLRGWSALQEILRALGADGGLWTWTRIAAATTAVACALALTRGEPGRGLRGRCGWIAAYLAVFLAFYAGSGMAHSYQGVRSFWARLAPLWFFSTILFAGCVARLLDRALPRGREIAIGAVALTLAAGCADLAGLLVRGRPATPAANVRALSATKGYDLVEYFDKLVDHLDGSLADRFDTLARFPDDPELVLPSAAHSAFEHSGRSLSEAIPFVREHCEERWTTALLGLGLEAAPKYGHAIPEALERLQGAPPEARIPLAEAVGRVALGLQRTPEKIDAQSRLDVPAELRRAFLRGAGWRIQRMYPLRPDLAHELVDRQPQGARAALWEGYVRAAADNTIR